MSWQLTGALLLLLSVAPARAAVPTLSAAPRSLPTWARLLPPECPAPPVDLKLLLELLRTELRDDGVQQVDSGRVEPIKAEGPQAYLRLSLSCEPDVPAATLRIEDPLSLKAVERQMEFDDLPASAKPRALALGFAELLRASWTWLAILEPPLVSVPEGSSAPAPSEPPESPTPAPPQQVGAETFATDPPVTSPPADPAVLLAHLSPSPTREPVPRAPPDHSPSMQLSGKALWFLDPGNPVWGGQVVGEYGRWSLGAQLLASSAPSPRGDVALRLVTGTLGFTALELASESLELRGGVTLSAGRASVGGTPLGSGVKGGEGTAPYFGAVLFARTRWWFSSAWACTLEAEAGRAAGLIATVDGQETASLAGWQGGLSLGLSFAP